MPLTIREQRTAPSPKNRMADERVYKMVHAVSAVTTMLVFSSKKRQTDLALSMFKATWSGLQKGLSRLLNTYKMQK